MLKRLDDVDLYLGDCIEVLKTLPDGSVDCCVSDIPYGISYQEDWDVIHKNKNSALLGRSPKNLESKIFKTRGKPLNGWSAKDKERSKEFQKWCESWLSELYRVLKPCSPVMILCGRQNQHRFTVAAEDSGFILKDVISWNKGKAPFRSQKISNIYYQRGLDIDYSGDWRLGNLSPYHEPVVWLFKPYKVGTTITDNFIENKLGCFNSNVLMSNIIDCKSLTKNSNHPTEKPLSLMETLISLVSFEGHTVLDMFMGSGSTGVACVNTGRKFIGIELDENYFNISEQRILQAQETILENILC